MSFAKCKIQMQRTDFKVDAEFTIPAKGVLGIFGHSGSGKTTLLRCVAGLEKGVKGRIEVNGETWLDDSKNISSQQRNIGYIFQESRLFPHLTVAKNLVYGANRSSVRRSVNGTSIDHEHLLELLNIQHLLDRYPFQLSGGEKQRVAIGRALLKNPQMLLLDEPLASLDEKRKQEILPFLDKLHEELSVPMLYVSHSMEEVSRLCDHLLVMEQGVIKFSGSIRDALISPESPLATAENSMALLEGNVSKQEKDFQLSTVHTVNGNAFQVQGVLPIGQHVRLRVQASDVSLTRTAAIDSSILNIIEGVVVAIIEQQGAHVLLQLDINNDILLARITGKSYRLLNLGVNQKVFVQIKAVSIHSL
jgi:molybdate transport system ATP-binding protein